MNNGVSTTPSELPTLGAPDRMPESVRLGELLESLGDNVVARIGAIDIDRAVYGAEFYDPFDTQSDEHDVILIVPSVGDPSPAALERLAIDAVARSAPAIAIKFSNDALESVTSLAHKYDVSFLRVADRVGWRYFDALLTHTFGERRHSEDTHRDRGTEPLFALANELANAFGGSVAIEDLGRRIIAYSSVAGQLIDPLRTQGILTRKVPDSPFNDDQYRTVLRATEPVKYPRLDDEEPRVAVAVRAGSLPLGTIWAIDASGEPGLAAVQRDLITSAAAVAAAHMLDNIQVRRATQIPREDRCRTLLDGHQVAGSELAELGISEERGAALIAFAPGNADQGSDLAQLRSTVQRHLSLHHSEVVTVTRGAGVYALVTHDPTRPLIDLVAPLLPVVDRLIGHGTVVALPGIAHRASTVATLRELADRLLTLTFTHQSAGATAIERVATVDALRPKLLFEQLQHVFAESPELRSPEVTRLCQQEPDFAHTLASWFAHFGSIAGTARSLGVHENTVRYRLRKIEQEFDLTLGDPDMILAVWLQLRAGPTGPQHPA